MEAASKRPPGFDASVIEDRVRALRASIAPDVYEPTRFIPREHVEHRIVELTSEIQRMQELVDNDALTVDPLARALHERPSLLYVLQLLFISPAGAGFADGRELPEHPVKSDTAVEELASLAIDLGLPWILPTGANVRDLVRLGTVAVDSRRRGFRRRDSIDERVERLIDAAIAEVRARLGVAVQSVSPARWPQAQGRVRTMIEAAGLPVAAVQFVLQAQSGGRQQRDLTVTFPQLQADLDELPCSLLLIADGRGVKDAGPRALRTLIGSVAACLTLKQAENGELAEALASAVLNRGARESADTAVDALIAAQLRQQPGVVAAELPIPSATATLAIARYAAARPELALRLTSDGVHWVDGQRVARAQALSGTRSPDPNEIVALVAELLELREQTPIEDPNAPAGLRITRGMARRDAVLPPELVVGATVARVDEELVRAFARVARRASADASVSLLIASGAEAWRSSASADALRSSLATSVVVIDVSELVDLSGATAPRDVVVRTVLAQADLTKANPFNTTGATPRQMFFGRAEEEGRLRTLLRTNSAALIGGRRIGKTSLLQAGLELLDAEQWQTAYADCQEASDWATFAAHVSSRWNVAVEERFRPSLVADMVAALDDGSDRPLVIALDEVDGLLRWDLEPRGGVREVLFRAFRALSQEGRCQFVFSGERLLAERLWDPSSPHWNFCLPVPVKQLDRAASDELITQPFRALGVTIADADEFARVCWERTQGHPQVLQYLGDMIVRRLNDRPPSERAHVAVADVKRVTESGEFRRHYLVTYWGQANRLERLISALVVTGATRTDQLRAGLRDAGAGADGQELLSALRMLELYGIVDLGETRTSLRASWLGEAMTVVGGAEAVVTDFREHRGTSGEGPLMLALTGHGG